MLVADLLLDEPGVVAVLDQVGDVGPAKGMEVQTRVQAQGVPAG